MKLLFALAAIFVLSFTAAAQEYSSRENQLYSQSKVQPFEYTAAFWNDNFIKPREINRFFGAELFNVADDKVTASLWFRAKKQIYGREHQLNLYYSILTSREAGYRTDMLTLLYRQGIPFGNSVLFLGAGIGLAGNLYGEKMQNFLHRITGGTEVFLDYRNSMEIYLLPGFGFRRSIPLSRNYTLQPEIEARVNIPGGPGSGELRLTGKYAGHAEDGSVSWSIEHSLGYVHYFMLEHDYSTILDEGVLFGAMISFRMVDHLMLSAWLNGGQYGNEGETHFGLALSWSAGSVGGPELREVRFP